MSGVIFLGDSEYPFLLKQIPKPPGKLHFLGNWDRSLFDNCISVVGSRRMTFYGKKVTQKIVGELAMAGLTVVSGFMYGVDSEAHKACLSVGGRTIAVMPCGVDVIHPEINRLLYREIIANRGLIVSEFEPGHPPGKWTYPKRNKTVAGLSQGLLVVEAAAGSGSLITAAYAKKYDRQVFAVPGPINSENTVGIVDLLREGAVPVGSSSGILSFYRERGGVTAQSTKDGIRKIVKTGYETRLLNALRNESLSIDELSVVLKESDISEITSHLTLMLLKGIISEEEGRYYVN